jgi:oligoendopeptidase F
MNVRKNVTSAVDRRAFHAPAWVTAVAVLAGLGIVAPTRAADSAYQIDLTRYFVTANAEQVDRAQLIQALDTFAEQRISVRDAAALESYLHQAESLRVRLLRHEGYLHLKSSLDTTDPEARAGTDDLDARLEQLTSAVNVALQGVTPADFAELSAPLPSLAKYRYLVEAAQRRAVHTLPPAQQLILDQLSKPTLSALFDLYTQAVATTPFAAVETPDGPKDVRTDRRGLSTNADPSIRRRAAERYLEGYASRGPLYSSILLDIVRERDRAARLRHFDGAPSAVYFDLFETPASVNACLANVARYANLYRDYQTLRAQHLQKVLALTEVHSWDLAAPLPGFATPWFTVEGIAAAALEALKPIGPEYTAEFRALLNQANGRADIAPGAATRYNAGYSVEAPGVPSALYIGNFRGTLNDARVIVHEGGHAVHGQLRVQHILSPFYAAGPNWMGEGIAILNELLLYDHLATTSRDASSRAYFLQALVDDMSFQIFTSAEEATLEQGIYEGVAAGRIRNAAELDALTRTTLATYDIWSASEPDRQHVWMTKQLMFEDPLYLVNYLYAGLFATKAYAMIKADEPGFRHRYLAYLKEGFDAPPRVLLQRLFGRDMPIEQLVSDDMGIFKAKVAELAALYQRSAESR